MAETQKGIRMAVAKKDDIKKLYTLYNVLENLGKYHARSLEDFDHFDEEEKRWISRFFVDGEIDLEELINYLHPLTFGFHRVVMGYEVLFDNCADPELSYLDFNKSIKESILVWNHLAEHLKEGREVCITPDSTIGQMILISEKESDGKEVSNG